MRRGRYYIGRVVKLGILDQKRLKAAIRKSAVVSIRSYTWTITDISEGTIGSQAYIFAKLSKYSQEGHVTIVDSEKKSQLEAPAPNLLRCSSPFVYLPEFSGIAYLHVWNGIQEDVFRRRFKTIVEATHRNFFVDCTIEPITDYRTFGARVSKLRAVREISAKVHPPNPLFGRIWKNLEMYIRKRNADEVDVKETKKEGDGIHSHIIALINAILKDPTHDPKDVPDLADAALLMAADGYGTGKVIGEEGDTLVTIRTTDNQSSFLFDTNPAHEDLALEAEKLFQRISKERGMNHGKED